ncbi:hypothetical protein ABID56_001142 [Alkalibacillus flavidus]|uniref:Uncharacterized protein n=2 Tax=Alkalibacillus flavidus TaxID=546021 RepID=A0ABV2KTZ2_9BACI
MKEKLGDEDLDEFLDQYLDIPDMRERAIYKAENEKNSERVIELIESADRKRQDWLDILYRHYGLLGRIEEQRELAKKLVGEYGMDYYNRLRKLYSDNEWSPVVDTLIENNLYYFQGSNYYKFLLKERRNEALLSYGQASPYMITEFGPYLQDHYPEEVAVIFQDFIHQEASKATNRKDYQGVSRIIKQMQKVCGYEASLPVIEKLATDYVKRPAFIDELQKMKV